jgi:hypothetical protein
MPCLGVGGDFDALRHAKVFSTLDLRFGYHQLPLWEGDKVKTTFSGIDPHGNDCLYLHVP